MPLMNLTSENFDAETERHDIVIIDFWAEWCAPCKAFAPVFEAAAAKFPDILFAKVDTEAQAELAHQFEVRSIPTLLAVKDGTIVKVHVGMMMPDKFAALIADLFKIDAKPLV